MVSTKERIVCRSSSPEITQFVRNHYFEVFGKDAPAIYAASLIDNINAELHIFEKHTQVLGGFRVRKRSNWSLQILDFVVLPIGRSSGVGKALIEYAKNIARRYGAIFLDTRVYPLDYLELSGYGKIPYQFSTFLNKMGFKTYKPYPAMMSEAEWLAYKYYDKGGLTSASFRMYVDDRSILLPFIKRELDNLTDTQCATVLTGLDKKLTHFNNTGNLSYKYEVCPICKDIGSTLENPRCDECYLKIGCKHPFYAGFRHDPQVGYLYFKEMYKYLLNSIILREN